MLSTNKLTDGWTNAGNYITSAEGGGNKYNVCGDSSQNLLSHFQRYTLHFEIFKGNIGKFFHLICLIAYFSYNDTAELHPFWYTLYIRKMKMLNPVFRKQDITLFHYRMIYV